MSFKWYSVKTLYKIYTVGTPKKTDKYYNNSTNLIEERIVLFKARNFEEAIKKANAEAMQYSTRPYHTNPYGQTVKMKYMNVYDCFELFDEPGNKKEIFSATEIVSNKLSNKKLFSNKFGKYESKSALKKRKRFLNQEFNGRVY